VATANAAAAAVVDAAAQTKTAIIKAETDIKAGVLSAVEAAGRAAQAVNNEAREIAASIAAGTAHAINVAGDVVRMRRLLALSKKNNAFVTSTEHRDRLYSSCMCAVCMGSCVPAKLEG
jgi:hypothetical protein